MEFPLIVVSILITFVTVYSVFLYTTLHVRRVYRVAFIAIRILLLILVVLAIWEPSFTFNRLVNQRGTIPVLIDASASMSIFEPGSELMQKLHLLQDIERTKKVYSNTFTFYAFGDSLRPIKEIASLPFNDRRSFFPQSFRPKDFHQANELIIVSDANWSNARIPFEILSDKRIYYVPLSNPKQRPFLHIKHVDVPQTTIVDSQSIAKTEIEGYFIRTDTITVNLKKKSTVIFSKKIHVDSGYNKRTLPLQLPNNKLAHNLYTIDVQGAGDSLDASHQFTHQIVPRHFSFYIYTPRPSLDVRFLKLALQNHNEFRAVKSVKNTTVDVLFLFHNDTKAQQLLSRLKPTGVVAFIGCLPCSTMAYRPQDWQLADNYGPLAVHFQVFDKTRIPPPSHIFSCKNSTLDAVEPILNATITSKQGNHHPVDILFTSRYKNKQSIMLPAKGIWRWDFWPHSSSRNEEQSFAFTKNFGSMLRSLVLSEIASSLFVYPTRSTMEMDSVRFSVVLPAEIPDASVPPLSIRIEGTDQNTYIDTTVHLKGSNINTYSAVLPPLPPGNYLYTTKIQGKKRVYRFSDSLTIHLDKSEFMINGQNTLLLKELGTPLVVKDSKTIRTFLESLEKENSAHIVSDIFRIKQTWVLLAMLMLLFAAEWTLRRISALD